MWQLCVFRTTKEDMKWQSHYTHMYMYIHLYHHKNISTYMQNLQDNHNNETKKNKNQKWIMILTNPPKNISL